MHRPSCSILLRGLAPFASLALAGQAAAGTWAGLGADGNWMTPANWAGTVTPTSPEALVFAGATRLSSTNNFPANTQFNGLSVAAGAGYFDLSGNAINLGGDVVLNGNGATLWMDVLLLQNTALSVGANQFGGYCTISDGGSAFGITKTGTGLLALRRANTYTGTTTIREGTLDLWFNHTYSPPTSYIISSNSPLVTGGGGANVSLILVGKNNASSIQTFNGTTLQTGRTSFAVTRTGSGKMTLNLGTLTRGAAAIADFVINSVANSPITIAAATPLANGILGAWATIGTDWATHVGGVLTNAPASIHTVLADPAPAIVSNPASHILIDAASTNVVTLAAVGVTDIHTLRVTDGANRTISVGSGSTLRLGAAGGIWRALSVGTANALLIDGGTLTAGGAANTDGDLILNAGGAVGTTSRANVGLRITSAVADNGSGRVSLVKTGVQTVNLNGTNTYSGDTYVLNGRLNSTVAGNLGKGSVRVMHDPLAAADHGIVMLSGAGDYTNDFFISGMGPNIQSGSINYSFGALSFGTGPARVTGKVTLLSNARIAGPGGTAGEILGQITGPFSLTVGSGNQAQFTLILHNPSNDWTGTTTLTTSSSSGGKHVTLRLGASEVVPNGAGKGNLVLNNGSGNTGSYDYFDLNGFNETINGLVSTGSAGVGQRYVRNSSAAAATATLTLGDGDAGGDFSGLVQNGHTSAILAIRKIGAGKQVFSGACSYTGSTVVDGGELEVSGTLTTNNSVTANAGGTFAFTGTGVLGRAVTVNGGTFRYSSTNAVGYAGALTFTSGRLAGTNWWGNLSGLTINTGRTVAPGDSVGMASSGSQFWSNGGAYEFEITNAVGVAGTAWDHLAISGALDLSGLTNVGGFTVKLVAPSVANFDAGTAFQWPLATCGSLAGTFSTSLFTVDASAFAPAIKGGFKVTHDGTTLMLEYTPSNGTLLLIR